MTDLYTILLSFSGIIGLAVSYVIYKIVLHFINKNKRYDYLHDISKHSIVYDHREW